MSRFWQGEHHDIEAELRSLRPQPRPAFIAVFRDDLHRRMRRPKIVRRAAFATVLTAGMLSAFATLGGIGYASSAANSAFHVSKIERLVGISHHPSRTTQTHNKATGDNPIFGDQYRPGKGCGDKNHVHARHNECKKTH
jgi:hypothetical protein